MPSNIFKSVPAIPKSEKGSANGVATLDGSGLVPSNQLPSYVDDVLEYSSVDNFPASGDIGKIYVATDTNKSYRWSGSTYVELSAYALATQAAAGLMSAQDKTKLDGIAAGAQVNPGNATTSADGLMSAGDKTKLDGIASGANKTVVSDSLADTSTTNALSAAKGKALNDSVTTLNSNINGDFIADCNSVEIGKVQRFRFNSSTLNTPYKQGITAFSEGWVESYLSNANYGIQKAYATGNDEYTRILNNGTWGNWYSVNNNIGNYTQFDGTLKSVGSIDLNTLKTSGRFYAGSGCTNLPVASQGGCVDVYVVNANYVRQVFYIYNNERIFTRAYNSGAWTSWQELALNSDLTDVLYFKSVTLSSSVCGTNWTTTSRKIGTALDLFGIAANKIVSIWCIDGSLSPGSFGLCGMFNGDVYVGANQSCTLSGNMTFRIAYKK